jgi:hypothetical protein
MTHCVNTLAELSCGEGCALALAMLVALGIYLLISKAVNKSGLASLEDGSFMQEYRDAEIRRRMEAKIAEHPQNLEEKLPACMEVVERDPRTGRPTRVKVRVPVEREIRIDFEKTRGNILRGE